MSSSRPHSIAVILNPHASRAADATDGIATEAASFGLQVVSLHLLTGKDFTHALQAAVDARPSCIVIGGGDGTIRAAAEFLRGRDIPVVLLALGTTNNFARSLGLPMDWKEALRLAVDGKPRTVYLGEANGHVFCNTASVGISSRVAQDVTKEHKRLLGRFAYALASLRLFTLHAPFHCTIREPAKTHGCRAYEVIVTNGGFHAGREVAKTSAVEHGLSLAVPGRGRNRWRHLRSLAALLLGNSTSDAGTLLRSGPRFHLETSPPQPVELDGEVLTHTPVEFSVSERTLTVLLPPESPR